MSLTVEKRKQLSENEHFKNLNAQILGEKTETYDQVISGNVNMDATDYKYKAIGLNISGEELFNEEEVALELNENLSAEREQIKRDIENTKTHRFEKTRRSRMADAAKAAKKAGKIVSDTEKVKNMSDFDKYQARTQVNLSHYEMQTNMAKAMAHTKDEEELLLENARRAFLIKEIRDILDTKKGKLSQKENEKISSSLKKLIKEYTKILIKAGELEEKDAELYELNPELIYEEIGYKKELAKDPDLVDDKGVELSDYIQRMDIMYLQGMSNEEILDNFDTIQNMYLNIKYAKEQALLDDDRINGKTEGATFIFKMTFLEHFYRKACYIKSGTNKSDEKFKAVRKALNADLKSYEEYTLGVIKKIKIKPVDKPSGVEAQKIAEKYQNYLKEAQKIDVHDMPNLYRGYKDEISKLQERRKTEKNQDAIKEIDAQIDAYKEKMRIIAYDQRLVNGSFEYTYAGGLEGEEGFINGKIISEPLLRAGIQCLLSKEPFSSMGEKNIDNLIDKLTAGTFLPSKKEVEDKLQKNEITKDEAEKLYDEIKQARAENEEGIKIFLNGIVSHFDNIEATFGMAEMFSYDYLAPNMEKLSWITSLNQVFSNVVFNQAIRDMLGEDGERIFHQIKYYHYITGRMSEKHMNVSDYVKDSGEKYALNEGKKVLLSTHEQYNEKFDLFYNSKKYIKEHKNKTFNTVDSSISTEESKLSKQIGEDPIIEEKLKKEHYHNILRFNLDVYTHLSDEDLLLRYDELKRLAALGRMYGGDSLNNPEFDNYKYKKQNIRIRMEVVETLCARASLLLSGKKAEEREVNATRIKLNKLTRRYGIYKRDFIRTVLSKTKVSKDIETYTPDSELKIPKDIINIEKEYDLKALPETERILQKKKDENADPKEIKLLEYAVFQKTYNYHLAGGVKKEEGFKNEGQVIREPIFRNGLHQLFRNPVFKEMPEDEIREFAFNLSAGITLPTYDEVDKMEITDKEKEGLRKEIEAAREKNIRAFTTLMEKAEEYYDKVANVVGADLLSPEFCVMHKDDLISLSNFSQVLTELLANKFIRGLIGEERGEKLLKKAEFCYHHTTLASNMVTGAMAFDLNNEMDEYDGVNITEKGKYFTDDIGYMPGLKVVLNKE